MSQNFTTIPIRVSNLNLQIATYIDRRTDKWIILLHGLQSNQKMYDSLREQKFLRSYSVLSLNFLGFGESSHPNGFEYNLEEQCQVVIQIIEKLKIKSCVLIGHSFGGMVGILLLERLKNQIDKFINLEGNLSYEQCGASRLIVEKYSYEQFVEFGFEEFLADIEKESEISAPFRLEWLRKTSPNALYRTAKLNCAPSTGELSS